LPLDPPARNLGAIPLATKVIAASSLYRISRHASGEPFFGRSGGNRFDDPSRRYGTCYFGFDLQTAVAETILHDEVAVNGRFSTSYSDFASRHLVRFKGGQLVLANLTGTSLKTLGGDGSLSTITPYRLPQLWSMAIHRHPQKPDGILYVSRHLNDRLAAVVFDRARATLGSASYTPLTKARSVLDAIAELHISFDYP
jgi:hypothetical protein